MSAVSTRWGWFLGIAFAFSGNYALAQITPDGTLPNNSNVRLQGNTFNITGGTQAGSNLFHSFGQFSVPTGGTAFFNNAVDIQNIISRVTGGSISNIDGLIRANGTANLFLINPSGIVFGQNASLNVGGSFVASTANAIQFGNLGFFSASNPNSPALLTINPSALFFNQIAAAPIQNNSVAPAGLDQSGFNAFGLRVPDGRSLLLVGGDISMDGGRLNAFGGRVDLGGLAGAGTVGLNGDDSNLSLSFPENVARADVSLINAASVDVIAENRGSITINARNIDIFGRSRLLGGIGLGLGTPESQAGDITLNAIGTIRAGQAGRILNIVDSNAIGNAGNINVTADSLSLTEGTQLAASVFGRGNAGNVKIQVRDNILFDGIDSNGFSTGVFSSVEQGASGKGGNINITTGALALRNGARLNTSTFGQGDTGSITVKATDTISLDGVGSNGSLSGIFNNVSPGGVGEGGNISLTTEALSASNGAQIIASTFGKGNAGNITINARDSVSLRGVSSNGFSSGVYSSVESDAVGNAGNISVTTGLLSLTNGAGINTNTLGQGNAGNINVKADTISLDGIGRNRRLSGIFSGLGTSAVGKGEGGNINVTTGVLKGTNGARISTSTLGQGSAGNVTIDADTISLNGASSSGFSSGVYSSVESDAVGDAGNINVTTGVLKGTNGARISTSTLGQGNAGNVTIDARNGISFDGRGTGIVARMQSTQEGRGGNINIATRGLLSVTNGAQLGADTVGRGNAGDVAINARDVHLDGANSVVASAVTRTVGGKIGEGKGGNVTITTGSLSVSNGARLIAGTNAKGDAGSVTINADNLVSFDGVGSDGRSSQAITGVLSGGEGNAGDITINTGSLSVTNGAQLITIAQENGEAGNVSINARDTVSFSGISRNGRSSSIVSNLASGVEGKAGDITITTGSFSATDGAFLTASTNGKGNAGSVTINAGNTVSFNGQAYAESIVGQGAEGNAGGITISTDSLSITNGAILTTTTAGQGNAGSVRIDASDRILLAGSDTGIFSRVTPEAVGTAGNITITTGSLFVTDEAQLSTSNIGQGQAGEIAVTAGSIRLDKKGSIQATTVSGNGGNINLNVQDLLLLRRGSQISTTAGTARAGGDGGNITINSPFIVAVPQENSDITANAFTGSGGRVDITASGIYGIESRPRQTEQSDITASSELGVQGTIDINTLDVDPNRGLLRLPTGLVNTPGLASSNCNAFIGKKGSEFTVTGRGGLPPSPDDFLSGDVVWTDNRLSNTTQQQHTSEKPTTKPAKPKTLEIIPATGWVINDKGEVTLISSAPSASSSVSPPTCVQQ